MTNRWFDVCLTDLWTHLLHRDTISGETSGSSFFVNGTLTHGVECAVGDNLLSRFFFFLENYSRVQECTLKEF